LLDSDSNGTENSPKDYFEPGIPAELIRTSRKNSPNVSLNGSVEQASHETSLVPSADETETADSEDHDDSAEMENPENGVEKGANLSTIDEDE